MPNPLLYYKNYYYMSVKPLQDLKKWMLEQTELSRNKVVSKIDELIEENKPKRKTSVPKTFVKPTIEEIQLYCQEKGYAIDCELFFDHYEVRNWIPKGYNRQMSDWKAAIRTWMRNPTNIQRQPIQSNGKNVIGKADMNTVQKNLQFTPIKIQ